MLINPNILYNYWFGEIRNSKSYVEKKINIWFTKDPVVDRYIQKNFYHWLRYFVRNELESWKDKPREMLTLIVLLDQIPRNVYRNTIRAHEFDEEALSLARDFYKKNWYEELHPIEKLFILLPYQHSENLDDQAFSYEKFCELNKESPPELKMFFEICERKALLHLEAIQKFSRFPHRNDYLARNSSVNEIEFLKNPEHHF